MSRDDHLVKLLREGWPGIQAVYLFGSVAKGEEHPDSDLDVAGLGPNGRQHCMDLQLALSMEVGQEVDLVDLRSAPTILQKEVISGGHLLWADNRVEVEFFELYVWASYQKLSDERAQILAAGKQSGRFYNP